MYQCRNCRKLIKRRDCPKELHRCNTVRCQSCKQMVKSENHECFWRTIAPMEPSAKLIFFDFETDQSSGEHIVNYAVAQYANGDETTFGGYGACDAFCSWLFTNKHEGFTAIAHNMRG